MNSLMNIYDALIQITEGIKIKSEVSFSLQTPLAGELLPPLLQIRVVTRIKGDDTDLYIQQWHSSYEIEKLGNHLISRFIDETNAQID